MVVTNSLAEGLPFVVFGDDWASHVTSAHHIARQLARTNPVLYVNGMGTRSPRLNIYDLRRAVGKFKQLVSSNGAKTQTELPNGHVYSPFIVPFNSVSLVRKSNQSMLRRHVGDLLRQHSIAA